MPGSGWRPEQHSPNKYRMMESKKIVVRRTFISLITFLLLSLMVWVCSTTLFYFRTGAEWGPPADYNFNTLTQHAPEAQWVKFIPDQGLTLDTFLRKELAQSYLTAWQALNYGYRTKNTTIIKDHYAETQWAYLQGLIQQQSDYQVEQADLSHNLYLHTFSLDKQLAAFSDRGVRIKKKISRVEPLKTIYSDIQEADFDVVMTLDDGNWRIRHLQRRVNVPVVKTTTEAFDSNQVQIAKKQFYIKGIPFQPAGVNYYPMETPWFDFWTQFDAEVIDKDLAIVRDLGLNTIRIFVFYDLFGGKEVEPAMMEKLEVLLDLAQQNELKVVVTLFDFLPSYAVLHYPSTERHLKQILTRFQNHSAILAWDLKNEPDLDFENHGQEVVLEWLDYMLSRGQVYDPNHPLTIGWSTAQAATNLTEEVDFISFHFYENIALLPDRLERLQMIAADKPIMISEFGLSTYKSLFLPGGHTEMEQAEHYENVLRMINKHGPASFISWTLYDFPQLPKSVFGGPFWRKLPQKRYGIIDTNGKQKPAAAVLSGWEQ